MKYPKNVYVVREEELNGNEFLTVFEKLAEVAEVGEVKEVAVYHLSTVLTVTAKVKAEPVVDYGPAPASEAAKAA
jgi:hypothetical protein